MPAPLSTSESAPKFRVAICGAGIAGLVLATTIGKYDSSIPIDIYEAHDNVETAGVGITLWRRTREILTDLGLFDEFTQISTHNPDNSHSTKMRRSDMREGGYAWYQRINRYGPCAMQRQKMVALLEKYVPASCIIHPKKRLVSYTEHDQQDTQSTTPIRLEFADGTTTITDVLIGADGVRSIVRKTLFDAASEEMEDSDKTNLRQCAEAMFTGIMIYRCIFPAEALRQQYCEHCSVNEMVAYHGKGKVNFKFYCDVTSIHFFRVSHCFQSLITYPIAKGSIINLAAYTINLDLLGTRYEGRWVSDATRDELVECFDNFEPDVMTLLKLCEKPSKTALHIVKRLPFCVRNRVALIGDACHAMTPHFGAGAGQAIEDAFVLGRLIAHPLTPLSRIPDALRIYEEIRLPFASDIVALTLSTGLLYNFMEPGFYDGTRTEDGKINVYEREGMEAIKEEVERRWNSLDELKGALQQWEEAESKLKASINQ